MQLDERKWDLHDRYGPASTCGLCRFYFEPNDETRTHQRLSPNTNTRRLLPCDNIRRYHPGCLRYFFRSTGQYGILNPDMAIATMHEPCHERPPIAFEKNRRVFLKRSFARNLFNALSGRLPEEICEQIAVYFAKEPAVQAIRDAWLEAGNFRPGSLFMTIGSDTALWAQYIQFEGVGDRYIKSLSYRSRGGDEVKIFDRQGGIPLNIFIAHNCLGIVDLIATTGETVPKKDQNESHWWTILSAPSGPFSFKGRFDGIKIRDLTIFRNEYKYSMWSRYKTRWSTLPAHITPVPKPLTDLFKSSHFNIVRAVDWNKPGIKGYSFCLSDDTILRIIPDDGSRPVDYNLRGNWHRYYCWLYLPMDDDERVSEFWIRRHVGERGPTATLIIHTSRGRNLVLGSPLEPYLSRYPPLSPIYRLLGTLPEDKPCRVFYTASLLSPSWFLFEDILYHPMNEYIRLGVWSPNIKLHEFYYTSAKLEGVREITPCHYCRRLSRPLITGLLLKYFDGSQRSVGQVRLDFLGTAREVTTDTMWIRFPVKEYSPTFMPWQTGIQSFDFVDPISRDEEGNRVLKVPMRGRLDWFITIFESNIIHHEKDELQDEMRQVLAYEKIQGNARSTPVRRCLSKVIGSAAMPTIHRSLRWS